MKKCYIGIDIGKTNMRFAVTEEEPVLKYYTKHTYSRGSKEDVFSKIFEGIDWLNGDLTSYFSDTIRIDEVLKNEREFILKNGTVNNI